VQHLLSLPAQDEVLSWPQGDGCIRLAFSSIPVGWGTQIVYHLAYILIRHTMVLMIVLLSFWELVLFEFQGEHECSSSSSLRARCRRLFVMQASLSSWRSSRCLRSPRSDPSRSSPASEDSALGLLLGDRIGLRSPPASSNGVSAEP